MVLRRQELPSEAEFATANERAAAILGLARQPVRSARAVQALAIESRRKAAELLPAAEALASELGRHAATLGLEDVSPRVVTAQATAALTNRLVGLTDATATARALAGADLPGDGVIYQASLDSAGVLAAGIAATLGNQVVQQVLVLAGSAGADAELAAVIVRELRAAARHDEQAVALGPALEATERAATQLMLDIAARTARPVPPSESPTTPAPAPTAVPAPAAEGGGRVTRQVAARQLEEVASELRSFADEHPEATIEISWRVVP
jgi:hypothetical protein